MEQADVTNTTTEKQCAQCGRTFRGRANRLCSRCNAHPCAECGRIFPGYDRICLSCRMTERSCTECGRTFVGYKAKCEACRAAKRECVTCGKTFTGRNRECASCRIPRRTCTDCDRIFRGTQLLCPTCRLIDRECVICGAKFRGLFRKCSACRTPEHPCVSCGRTIRETARKCQSCRITDRECVTCGRTHRRHTLECDSCSGRSRAAENARRARERASQVAGPLPRSVYVEVLASGPCVYCGRPAATVDHIWPLALGGHEARYNLAPACRPCNSSKGDKLLTHWDPVRVAHGVAHSPLVAAELERETADLLTPVDGRMVDGRNGEPKATTLARKLQVDRVTSENSRDVRR
jgi:hypothetical protein